MTTQRSDFFAHFDNEAEHIHKLLERLRLGWLLRHFPRPVVWASYVFVNGFVTIALLALLAVATGTTFVFPSLGPTAYLFFFAPLSPPSSPRHAIVGHAIGLVCGYAAFRITGMPLASSGFHEGLYWQRILAAALSLASTGALMILLRAGHPPAGATTLIVSLGIVWKPQQLLMIEAAVFLLTAQALLLNRLAGVPYPLWNPRVKTPPNAASETKIIP